jgi:hypothetical protein
MKIFSTSVIIALSVIVFVFIYTKYSSGKSDFYDSFTTEPAPQKVMQRNFVDVDFDITKAANTPDIPQRIRISNESQVYLVDYTTFNIIVYDTTGASVDTIGGGKGRGPHELLSGHALHFDTYNNLWVTDTNNGRGLVFDVKKDTSKLIITNKVPIDIIPLSNKEFLIDEWSTASLSRHDSTQSLLFNYESFLDNQFKWAYLLQGTSTVSENDELIKLTDGTNLIIKYNADGSIAYLRVGIPQEQEGQIFLSPRAIPDVGEKRHLLDVSSVSNVIRYPSIVNDEIHIMVGLVKIDDTFGSSYYISGELMDVFDMKTGDYKYSYKFPEPVEEIDFKNGVMAVITLPDRSLEIWKPAFPLD